MSSETSSRIVPQSRPTMKDVAALARVSLKTVSRVINEEPTVDAELAARVRKAATQLRYQPNFGASALRRRDRRSSTIGVVLEDLSHPFPAAIYRAIEEVASLRAVSALGGSLDESQTREFELVTLLMRHRVDGVIIAPASHDHQYLREDQEAGVPFVFVDRPPVLLKADAVLGDSRHATAGAVRHLLQAGHRRVAFLGDDPTIATAQERWQGYVDALRDAELPIDLGIVVQGLRTIVSARRAIAEMLGASAAPTAFFTGRNILTIGAVQAIRDAGLQHRVALVGFDDFLLANVLDPAVTVVAQDATAMGRLAAEMLFARINGEAGPVRVEVVPSQLIVRGSGEITPHALR